jgi:putative tryptophan/tyrosine transport system permease protein
MRGLGTAVFILFLILLFAPSIRTLSFNVWVGSVATGLCLAFVAIGVYITFRILDFPDLTIDGSFPLGAALAATFIVGGGNPYLTLPLAFAGGALAGMATAVIATRLRIHSLLASILTTTALLSINLRIMGQSNIPLLNSSTIFTPLAGPFRQFLAGWSGEALLKIANNLLTVLFVGLIVLVVKLLFDRFMYTEVGLAMRATGDNAQMMRALGTNTNHILVLGLGISNGLVGMSGAIFAQYQGFADVNMGVGLIIAGLAAVIVGETIFRPRHIHSATTAVILGMIIYRLTIAAALNIKLPLPGGEVFRIGAQDVKLATAVLVLIALWMTHAQKNKKRSNHAPR